MSNFIFKRKRKTRIISEINVTPLVDVMLVLLIVFMVTSPLMIAGVDLNLPKTTAKPLEVNSEPLSISIDKDGNLYLQKTMLSQQGLIRKLRKISRSTTIFVRGDKDIDYGQVLHLIGILNEAGFLKLSLISEVE